MKQQARVSAVLLEEMALNLGAHKALEVYLAASGVKITRTLMVDTELDRFLSTISDFDIQILLSKEKFLLGTDAGKGGYGNSFGAVVPTDHPQGHFCVYIGRDLLELDEARRLDENGDDECFGKMLGIPECCRLHFAENKKRFSATQNDPSLFTKQDSPMVPWCSHFPMYFGYGLFSHFPCSVACDATHKMAIRNEAMLRKVAPELAENFLNYQFSNYLYSEYDGVFSFGEIDKCQSGEGLSWRYNNRKLEATSSSLLSEIIFSCDCITYRDFELEFKREGAIRLITDASKYVLGFHCESQP